MHLLEEHDQRLWYKSQWERIKKKKGKRSNIHYIHRVRDLGAEEATHLSLSITMALQVVSCSVVVLEG